MSDPRRQWDPGKKIPLDNLPNRVARYPAICRIEPEQNPAPHCLIHCELPFLQPFHDHRRENDAASAVK